MGIERRCELCSWGQTSGELCKGSLDLYEPVVEGVQVTVERKIR
jgi:hypothetical protein